MKFQERSYSGKIFRPRPEIYFSDENRLLIVATPWGPRSAAKKVSQIILDYFSAAAQDMEATSPFEKLSCLSPIANNLRIATLLANDKIFREENKTEYTSGVELFAASIEKNDVVWLQVGHPNVLLARTGKGVIPLGSHVDLALDIAAGSKILPPLPSQLIGLDMSCNLTIGSFRPQINDKLILVSRSAMSDRIYLLSDKEWNLTSVSQSLAQNHPELAYWLGVLDL
ncbi:MAG: hypothetical protein SGJ18_00550 [Pseudomonadota bacterium]|mgnify:CR=1 FL=1|nr:hypothetical protein [Pseudomonadota bacterium]